MDRDSFRAGNSETEILQRVGQLQNDATSESLRFVQPNVGCTFYIDIRIMQLILV